MAPHTGEGDGEISGVRYEKDAEMTTPQQSISSGFGATTTAEEVLGGKDLSGKTIIVTGGYVGLGLETTRVLAGAGATVIVPARTPDKARANLKGMKHVELALLDLLNPASIDAFAETFLASRRSLDMLINNAGIMATPLTRDTRGYETQFAANHLGHFQLTLRLWPTLIKAKAARVISLASRGHRFSGMRFDDWNFERTPYDKWQAYGQSKTANALFAMGLDTRGKVHDVRAFSVHPGGILTELMRHLSDDDIKGFGLTRKPDGTLDTGGHIFKTIPQGAATTVWAATSAQLNDMGGVYCEDCDIANNGPAEYVLAGNGVSPWAHDPQQAERLWALSETLTGIKMMD